jgi:hypothetical protein
MLEYWIFIEEVKGYYLFNIATYDESKKINYSK